METRKYLRSLVLLLVLALVAAACSGGEETEAEPAADGTEAAAGAATEEGQADPEFIASSYVGEPQSLITLDANEENGIKVLSGLYTPLVTYDPETIEPVNAVAESIETEDNTTFVVTLKDGWTFHNGEPVTAESFVNAWNYGAFGPNAMQNAGFFEMILGYEDLQCGTVEQEVTDEETGETTTEEVADCEAQPPASETLAGLTVDSENQFTIELVEPQSFFVTRLGYTGYSPLPQAFYDDPDAFNEQPIGNGPLMMDGEWQHNQLIRTVAYPDFAGDNPMDIGGIEFRIYDDINTAVNDLLAGNLDIIDSLPAERASELRDQVPNFDESEESAINYIGFPMYDTTWGGDENQPLRAALSQAIDREAITEAIFDGGRAPAQNFLAPTIPGYQETVEGCDNWSYNPELAQQNWEESGGVGEPFTVYYNAGVGNEVWIEAVANMWQNELGIEAGQIQFEGVQPFGDYLERLDTQNVDGPFRLGWGMDYPHPQNYLQGVLDPDLTPDQGGANATFYSSEEFNQTIDEALSQTDLEASIPVWQEAVQIACTDVPLIPVFYNQNQFAWTDDVANVFVDAFGNLVYTDLTAAS